MDPIKEVVEAAQLHDWYAVAALCITISTQLLRKVPWLYDKVWSKIPDGWRWLVPVVKAALVAFVGAFVEGLPLTQALYAAVGGAVGIGAPSMGLAAWLRESPIRWDGGKGGKPPVETTGETVQN